jgi:hypothetical protein
VSTASSLWPPSRAGVLAMTSATNLVACSEASRPSASTSSASPPRIRRMRGVLEPLVCLTRDLMLLREGEGPSQPEWAYRSPRCLSALTILYSPQERTADTAPR